MGILLFLLLFNCVLNTRSLRNWLLMNLQMMKRDKLQDKRSIVRWNKICRAIRKFPFIFLIKFNKQWLNEWVSKLIWDKNFDLKWSTKNCDYFNFLIKNQRFYRNFKSFSWMTFSRLFTHFILNQSPTDAKHQQRHADELAALPAHKMWYFRSSLTVHMEEKWYSRIWTCGSRSCLQ